MSPELSQSAYARPVALVAGGGTKIGAATAYRLVEDAAAHRLHRGPIDWGDDGA